MAINFINIADTINPDSNKTYREENSEKIHTIPLGSLVEVAIDCSYVDRYNGLRLFVVEHTRDCDQTPLYSLSHNTLEEYSELLRNANSRAPEGFPSLANMYRGMVMSVAHTGFTENDLIVIRLPQS